MTPEMIDAAIIQLETLLGNAPGIPDYVKEDGKKFVEALGKWSAEKKAERESQRAAGQTAVAQG